MVGYPSRFAALGLGLDQPPLPVSATLAFATGAWSVTFDKILTAATLAAGNWTFVASDSEFTADTAVAAGDTVSGTATEGSEAPGPNIVNYAAAPADVLNLTGHPAAAFSDFPLTVT